MQISDSVSEVFRNRYDHLAEEYYTLAQQLIPRLTTIDQMKALKSLDAEYPSIEELLNTVLSTREQLAPVYYDLFDQLTTYFNLRGIVNDSLLWGTVLILKETRDDALIDVSILNTLAINQDSTGNSEAVFTIYDFILEEFAHDTDHPGLGAIHHNLSLAYKRQRELSQAVQHARESLRLERLHNHQRGIVLALMNLSELLYRQDEIVPSFLILQETVDLVDENSDLFLQASVTQRVATQMAEFAPSQRTDRTFKLAIRLWEQYDAPIGLAETYFDYAAFHHALDDLESARMYALQSLDLFEQVGSSRVKQVKRVIEEWLS